MDNVPESYKKLQDKARQRYRNFDKSIIQALHKMESVYGINNNSDLSLKQTLTRDDFPLNVNLRSAKTAMIFNNDIVYSLIESSKVPFGTISYVYKKQKSKNATLARQRLCIDIDNYYVSIIQDKPYLHIIHNELYYKYSDYIKLDKDVYNLLEYEPYDMSVTANLLINGKIPFSYYRVDNNVENKLPHLNKMQDGKILYNPVIITGPHEHNYDETISVLYRELPYSFDAKPLRSRRKDLNTILNPPLLKDEIDFLVQNKLNLEQLINNNPLENHFDIDKFDSLTKDFIK